MNAFRQLEHRVSIKQLFVCVGLDPHFEYHLDVDEAYDHMYTIVKKTRDHAAAFKINLA